MYVSVKKIIKCYKFYKYCDSIQFPNGAFNINQKCPQAYCRAVGNDIVFIKIKLVSQQLLGRKQRNFHKLTVF